MSLSSFSKENDEKVKANLTETIYGSDANAGMVSKLNIVNKPKEKKGAYTFSILPSQHDKVEQLAKAQGFKNKSEFLSAVIDAL